MNIDMNLQNYIDWEVKNVFPIKNKFGYRVILKYIDGSKKIQQKSGFNTEKEANIARDITVGELYSNTYIVYDNISMADFLVYWVEEDIKNRVNSYNTYISYRNVAYNHIIPQIGKKKLYELHRGDIQSMYNKISLISPSMVRLVKTVMNVSMKYAISKKMISINPAEGVPLPKTIKKNKYHVRNINYQKTLNLEQVYTLINASKDTPIYLQVLFSVLMGLRRSEIIGLKYSDIDFIAQTLTIQRQLGRKIENDIYYKPKTLTKQEVKLKTVSSYRTLKIPDYVFEAILNEKEIYEKNKKTRKNTFVDNGYICCSTYGNSRSKGFQYKYFKKILAENDLPNIRWHDLRATYCTILLKNKFNPKVISNLMGHSKEIITVDVYGDNKQIAADTTEEILEFLEEDIFDYNNDVKEPLLDIYIDIKDIN